MGFYTNFFNLIDNTLSTFIGNTVANTIGAINPVVHTLLLIAIGWFGWASFIGATEIPILTMCKKILYWSVVVSIATNTGLHSQYIVGFFWQLPDALANAIVQSTGANDSISNVGFIDGLFSKFDAIANHFNQQGIVFSGVGASIGNKIFAWVVWIAGGLLTATAAFHFIMSKAALAVLLGVSPIFIIMTIFTTTRKFFDAWMGQVLNFAFLPMLTAAFISIVLTALNQLMPQDGGITEEKAIELVALTIVSWYLLLQTPSIASALGGGVALGTQGLEQRAAGLAGRATAGVAGLAGRATAGVAKFGYNSRAGQPLRTAVGITQDKYARFRGKYNSVSKND